MFNPEAYCTTSEELGFQRHHMLTHTIHGTGIFAYILSSKTNQNVGKHTSPMDGMGLEISSKDVGTSFHGLNIAKLLHQNKVFNGLTIPFQYFIG